MDSLFLAQSGSGRSLSLEPFSRLGRGAAASRTALLLAPAADGDPDGGCTGCSPPPPARAREMFAAIDVCAWRCDRYVYVAVSCAA